MGNFPIMAHFLKLLRNQLSIKKNLSLYSSLYQIKNKYRPSLLFYVLSYILSQFYDDSL